MAVFSSPELLAKEHYVDAGRNTNQPADNYVETGAPDKPWKTLAKAAASLEPGDVCVIRSGDYRETLKPARSGAAGQPIVYKAAPGATVRINGCDGVPENQKWDKDPNNSKIWVTSLTLPLLDGDQVFEGQSMLIEARWPNVGETVGTDRWLLEAALATAPKGTDVSSTRFTLPVSGYDQRSTTGGAQILNPTGARIWVTPYPHQGWCNYTAKVTGYHGGSKVVTCDLSQAIPAAWEKCKASGGDNRYYLSGLLGFLDSQKEYFYDRTSRKLYVYRASETAPSSGSLQYKVRPVGIDLRGRSHIRLEGLNLFGCGVLSDAASSQIVMDRLSARYVSHWASAVCNGGQPAEVPPTGIQLLGTDMELRNSLVEASFGNGVDVQGRGNTVINNRIVDCNYLGLYYTSVAVSGTRHVISYNTVLRSGRTLLGGKFQSVKVMHNEMAHANMVSADGACIYLGWTDGGNSEIAYNYLHDNGGEARNGTGFYLDSNSYNFLFHHNLTEGVHLGSDASHIVVAQNTIFGRGIQRVGIGNTARYGWIGTVLFQNICVPGINYVGITQPVLQPAYEVYNHQANLHGDPLYHQKEDPVSGVRYGMLQSNSPAINVGRLKLEGLHDNVTDNRPDLGAYELGKTPWAYGQDLSANRVRVFEESKIPLTNRLTNGGFEEELTAGWTLNGTVRPSGWFWNDPRFRTGGYFSAEAQPGAGLTQTLTNLRPNTSYVLSVWTRINGTGTARLSVVSGGFPEKTLSRTGNNSATWFLNELPFQTGANSTTAAVSLRNPGNTVVYWDHAGVHWDLSSEAAACPPENSQDLVRNRGFEYGTYTWQAIGGEISQTQVDRKEGASSLLVTGRSQTWHGPWVGVPLVRNQRYGFSAWLKLPPGSAPATFNLGLNINLQNGALRQPVVASAVVSNTAWTELRGEFVFSEASPIRDSHLFFTSNSMTDFLLDQVSMVPLNQAGQPQEPAFTWSRPAPVVYGTALGAGQCNASTAVEGTWSYQPPVGTVLAAGTHTLRATFTPTETTRYKSVSANTTLEVSKRPLTVGVRNSSRVYGVENPAFVPVFSGFAAGESQSALSGTLRLDCSAGKTSAPGTYAITPSGLSSANYAITFQPGTLTVSKASQTMAFSLPATRTIPEGQLQLNATVSSGLLVRYLSSNPAIARVDGDRLVPVAAGTVRITAEQAGDANHLAVSVFRDLQVLAGRKLEQTLTFAPLPILLQGAAPLTLSAQASSGLPVTFKSSNPQVATVKDAALTVVGPGSAEITAEQAGNPVYAGVTARQMLTVVPLPERVINGGFESGTDPWYAFASKAAVVKSGRSGTNALEVTQRSMDWGSCGQQFSVQAGRDYRVRVWVKMSGAAAVPGYVLITLYFPDGRAAAYFQVAPARLQPNQWQKLEEVLSIPETLAVSRAQISLVTPGSKASFVADDFSVYDLSLTAVPALTNAGFEVPRVAAGFLVRPANAEWTFQGEAGVCAPPVAGNASQMAFVRGNGAVLQELKGLGVGQSYQIVVDAFLSRLPAGMRPEIEVRVGGQFIGNILPSSVVDTFLVPVFKATASKQVLELRTKNLQGSDTLFLDAAEVVLVPAQ